VKLSDAWCSLAVTGVLIAAILGGASSVSARQSLPQWTAISFATASSGWVVGPGLIWHTSTAGRHWQDQYHGSVQFAGIDAVSTAVAYAWGGSTLLRTTNRGRTWSTRYSGPAQVLSFVALGRHRGYLVTSAGLFVTRNDGTTWTAVDHPRAIAAVRFLNARQGWALTATDRVYKTTDAGRTWSLSFVLPDAHDGDGQGGYATGTLVVGAANSVWVVFAGGYGMGQNSYAVYHTSDDGVHWKAVVAVATAGGGPPPGGATGVSTGPMVPGGTGSSPGPLAVFGARSALFLGVCRFCSKGTVDVVRTSDDGLRWSSPSPVQAAIGLPTMASLSFPTASTGWLALGGMPGLSQILVTHNAGRTWRVVWPS